MAGTVLVIAVALVSATLSTSAPATARGGHDSTVCKPDNMSLNIPRDFFLWGCFDDTYLVLVNRSSLPVYVNLRGDLRNAGKQRYAPNAHMASDIVNQWAPHLLPPDFQIRIKVGANGGDVNLGYADDTGRKFAMLSSLANALPGILAVPDIMAQIATEIDTAAVKYSRCLEDANNMFARTGCVTALWWNVNWALDRAAVNGVLAFSGLRTLREVVKQVVEGIAQAIQGGQLLHGLGQDLTDWSRDAKDLHVRGGLTGPVPGGSTAGAGGTEGSGSDSGPPTPPGRVSLRITGSCTSSGGTLVGHSAGFTPGGSANIRAWYPSGGEYTNLTHRSAVRSDGTIRWTWPCSGDSAGRYTTEATDLSTGSSTGRVSFTIAAPAPPRGSSGGGDGDRTYTEQAGSHGSPTFQDPANASGQGPTVPAMSNVEISCKVHPASTIGSANPDGYWYRIASSPWNNAYYAVANTFWNGDIPNQKPYTHNTDFNVPDC